MGETTRFDSLKTLGKYPLIEKLSDGYLGAIYRSFDQELDRAVEIRILSDSIKWDAELEDLFRKECSIAARMEHPNIASIMEVSTEGQFPYMVMEALGDRNLKELIAQNLSMPFETKIGMMVQVAEGLGYAHKNNVLHRNLCPENIFLKADGCVKVRDFAIAHILMKHLPHPGVRWGAPIYLSPEQIKHHQSNVRSDIFAMGIVFYYLLTGVHPFYDPDSNKALDNILQNTFIPTFEQYPDFHPRIWHILKTCLAGKPDDRYESVEELLDACHDMLKDLSDDVRLMLSELQVSYASLKIAAEQPNASSGLVRLFKKVRDLLQNDETADYMQLDLLIAELIELYPEIQDAGGDPPILDSAPDMPMSPESFPSSVEEETPCDPREDILTESSDENTEVSALGNTEGPVLENTEVSASMEEERLLQDMLEDESLDKPVIEAQAEPVEETKPDTPSNADPEELKKMEPVISDESENTGQEILSDCESDETVSISNTDKRSSGNDDKPLSDKVPRGLYYRTKKMTFRTAALIVLFLVLAVVFYTGKGESVGETLRDAWRNYIMDPIKTVKASALKSSPSAEAEQNTIGEMEILEILNNEARSEYETVLIDSLEEGYLEDIPSSPLGAETSRADAQQIRMPAQQDESGRRKDEAWARQFSGFFFQGKYKEAGHIVDLWQGELPNSIEAQKSNAKIKEVQTRIATSTRALEEKQYRDALADLSIAERINPTDPQMTVLRNEIESRMTSARSTLTVYRLGDKASLLLDGKKVDSDGEIRGISIPIGSHTISVQKDGYLVTSRNQELLDGQMVSLVYDLSQRNIRPMIESDRVLLDQRETMEETYRFELEHSHGILRGSCRGELMVGYQDIVFRPSTGSHGFRVPFRLLELQRDGKSISLYFVSDNEHFHDFKFDDEEMALEFNNAWKSLKSVVSRQ